MHGGCCTLCVATWLMLEIQNPANIFSHFSLAWMWRWALTLDWLQALRSDVPVFGVLQLVRHATGCCTDRFTHVIALMGSLSGVCKSDPQSVSGQII